MTGPADTLPMAGRPVDDKSSDTLVAGPWLTVLDGEFDSPPSPPFAHGGPARVCLTWLFNHTGTSVLLAILAHASVSTAQAVLNPLFPTVDSDLNGLVGFGLLAIVVLVATRGSLGYPATQERVLMAAYPTRPQRAGATGGRIDANRHPRGDPRSRANSHAVRTS